MPYIVVEWKCHKCPSIHRIRFALILDSKTPYHIRRGLYTRGTIQIDDTLSNLGIQGRTKTKCRTSSRKLSGSRIYASSTNTTNEITDTVKTFMELVYTPEKDTLHVEICLDGD